MLDAYGQRLVVEVFGDIGVVGREGRLLQGLGEGVRAIELLAERDGAFGMRTRLVRPAEPPQRAGEAGRGADRDPVVGHRRGELGGALEPVERT
ncbi:MAG TPA: hypothetical protein VH912_12065 [Streptosporangiaceae bacterium]